MIEKEWHQFVEDQIEFAGYKGRIGLKSVAIDGGYIVLRIFPKREIGMGGSLGGRRRGRTRKEA